MTRLTKVIKPTSVTSIGRTGVRNFAGKDICKYVLQMKKVLATVLLDGSLEHGIKC